VITLAARPALGTQCLSPSQTLSGALSHPAAKLGSCNGRAALDYLNDPNNWGISFPTPNTLFYNLFYRPLGATLFVHPNNRSFDLLEVLNAHTGTAPDPQNIGLHMVGAYLNIVTGRVDPIAMDLIGLTEIWRQYASQGFYRPFSWNPDVEWREAEIVAYLVNHGIAP
jgi:hypothetical protein